jgi:hypothetical protein
MVRLKAILNCLRFGVLPWWAYEKKRHYDCSYFEHLLINIRYAWRWVTYQDDESDRDFESEVNKNM